MLLSKCSLISANERTVRGASPATREFDLRKGGGGLSAFRDIRVAGTRAFAKRYILDTSSRARTAIAYVYINVAILRIDLFFQREGAARDRLQVDLHFRQPPVGDSEQAFRSFKKGIGLSSMDRDFLSNRMIESLPSAA